MKKIVSCLSLLLCLTVSLQAQDKSLYKKEQFIVNNDTLPYRILLPLHYDATKKYPLILMLHGAGERGNDNESQLVHGAALFLKDSIREKYPAIVVFPQCPAKSFWASVSFKQDTTGNWKIVFQPGAEPTIAMNLAQQLLKKIMNDYSVNKSQVYVGGLSMGGMGTFEIVNRNPGLFAAAFPICGGADLSTATNLTSVKWWVFHGDADEVVPVAFSQTIAAALQKAGADVKLTVYPGVNHNSWDNAFAEPTLLPWLFSQHNKESHQ